MSLGRLIEINRYPVKSMMGESLETAMLSATGIPGDRAWTVRDEARGGICGAKRFATLMQCRARYIEEPPAGESALAEIELPTGERFRTDTADTGVRLSRFLDAPVTLWPLLPKEALDHYRRGAPVSGDLLEELRRIFVRTPEEPLPDLSAFPAELRQFESPPGTYFDAFPLLLLTRNALSELTRRAPGLQFDPRRFRPNLLIDAEGDTAFPERDWCGRRLRIGSAVMEVTLECPRCVMTTLPFAELPADRGIMRTLVRETDGKLGVYARPVTFGRIRCGDRIEWED